MLTTAVATALFYRESFGLNVGLLAIFLSVITLVKTHKKRKNRENMGLLLNEICALVIEETRRQSYYYTYSVSVSTAKISPQESQTWR